ARANHLRIRSTRAGQGPASRVSRVVVRPSATRPSLRILVRIVDRWLL
ncbi:MAG: hypothetical protein AVDCRST_MAG43-982, partial [uncultured Thermomicrobiales bacterium]